MEDPDNRDDGINNIFMTQLENVCIRRNDMFNDQTREQKEAGED